MDKVLYVIETALPVFIALAFGIFFRAKNFVDRNGIETLKKIVINVTLPFVLLKAFATAKYSVQTISVPVLFFLVCCLALALGFFFVRIFHVKSKLAPFVAAGCEAGMLGYALFTLLFPANDVSDFAIIDIGQTLFVFTVFKIAISEKASAKQIIKDMLHTPILWGSVIGILIGATGLYDIFDSWKMGSILISLSDFISAPTAMMILLVIGYDLSVKEMQWKKTAGLIAIRLLVCAICCGVVILINRTLLNGMIFEGAVYLMFILPPPFVIPVFANDPKDRGLISAALSSTTLITIILFAVLSIVYSL